MIRKILEMSKNANPFNSVRIHDRRGLHAPARLFERKRRWSEITGVTLHQTGCVLGTRPKRWDTLNAHIGVMRNGDIVLVNDPTDFIWHAQGLSKNTIGIEIDGNYEGIIDRPATVWKGGGGPHRLNNRMRLGLAKLLNWLISEFETNGAGFDSIHAHRQSSATRASDPGEQIWKEVAMPWMEQTGATDWGPEFQRGNGRPIPRQWNAEYTTDYWG